MTSFADGGRRDSEYADDPLSRVSVLLRLQVEVRHRFECVSAQGLFEKLFGNLRFRRR